jgi:phosphotransacetylase/acyl dehydratase
MAKPDDTIANRTIDEIRPGDTAQVSRKLTVRDLELLAALAGDAVPAAAAPSGLRGADGLPTVASGAWAALVVSTLLGSRLPGAGSLLSDQELHFRRPLVVGDTLDLTITVRTVDPERRLVTFGCLGVGRTGATVVEGTIRAVAPAEKVRTPSSAATDIVVEERGAKFRKLISQAETLPPILTAVVHAIEPNAVAGAVEAALANLIIPVFVGPEARISAAADEAGLDLSPWQVVATEHSAAAAATAVQMAHEGKVHALMKGSLHTDEFLHPIVAGDMKLRTERRLSHVFLMDVPSYDRPLLITDGAININPDLEAKKEIVQNAVQMAHALGNETPRVAILSAVEMVNPRIPSTLDAAALCKMSERGQIEGAILDGPLAFDNAVSKVAAEIKHIRSDVAGRADILLAPDLDAGNMIAKQLEYLAASEAAGVVLGARVPIVLTSRADSAQSRLASCAVATLIRAHQRGEPT